MSEIPGSSALTPTDHGKLLEPINADDDGIRPRCTATVRSTGLRCKKFPIKYASVCRSHGGAAGQVRRAAAVREQKALAMAALSERGYPALTDPVEELLRLATESVAYKDILAMRVAELTHLATVDRTGQESISAVLSAYASALKEASSVLVQVNRLNISARRVSIEAAQAGLLAEALRRAVYCIEAQLTYDQAQAVLGVASREFAALME